MDDVSLSPDSREVAIYIAGYIVKKYIKRVNCSDKNVKWLALFQMIQVIVHIFRQYQGVV